MYKPLSQDIVESHLDLFVRINNNKIMQLRSHISIILLTFTLDIHGPIFTKPYNEIFHYTILNTQYM